MKDLSIRKQLINDIKSLNPELLPQVYHYLELLKAKGINQKISLKPYIGCLSDEEAAAQIELIDKEFENIEGEW